MNNSFSILFFVLSPLICIKGFSQSKKWTLNQCIQYAMEHNIDIKKAEITTKESEEDRKSAVGNFLPNLNASAGQRYSFGKSSLRPDNTRVSGNSRDNNYNIRTEVTLFNGFKNRNSLKRAKINNRISQYDLEKTKNNLSLNISKAYLQILLNKELGKVAQTKVEISKEQLDVVIKQIESGAAPKGEQYKAESTLANDEQGLVSAQNDFELSKLNLAQFLQIPDYENFDVVEVEADLPSQERLQMSPEQIYALAEESLPEIKGSKLSIESAQKEIEIAKGSYYPSLSADYQFYTQWNKTFNVPNPESYFRTLDINKYHGGGLSLTIPIFNRMQTKIGVVKAKLNKQKAEYDLQDQKDELNKAIVQAHAESRAALKSYEAAQKSKNSSQIAFDYAKKRYDAGALSIYDFDEAKNDFTQAQSKSLREKYNFLFSLKILDFYSGVPLNLN